MMASWLAPVSAGSVVDAGGPWKSRATSWWLGRGAGVDDIRVADQGAGVPPIPLDHARLDDAALGPGRTVLVRTVLGDLDRTAGGPAGPAPGPPVFGQASAPGDTLPQVAPLARTPV
jgi:hypothetical protein